MAEYFPSDEVVSKVARSILTKNLAVKPGETVTIEGWPHTLPWAVGLAREARRMKAYPLITYEDEESYWDTVESGGSKILGAKAAHEFGALAETDVYIHMWGPGDRIRMNSLPEKKADELFAWNEAWYTVARKNGVRGARLELGRPFPTLERAYGTDQRAWTEQLVDAVLADPNQLQRRAEPLARALNKGKRIHITHPNGTDLTLGLAHRPPRVNVGRPILKDPKRPFDMLTSLPSGAIRVALDESVAEGRLVGNRTCYYDDGKATEPDFEFTKGKLVSASFGSGAERFERPFKTAKAGKDQPGWFGFGLNPGLHDTPQVEDIEAGTVTVSVGGNAGLGGKNRANFFGWAVIAGPTVEIDGKVVLSPK